MRVRGTVAFAAYGLTNVLDLIWKGQPWSNTARGFIDGLLASKGFVKKDADPVDLFVGYGTTVDKQQVITGYGGGMGFRFGGGMGMAETSTINNGTILLDIYNPEGKLLVWRGTATEMLNPSSNADKNYNNLKKGLTKLLKNFPPPVKK
jgi:hypothetical protein